MTALHTHHSHRKATAARPTNPFPFPRLHPDWCPPVGWDDSAGDFRPAPPSPAAERPPTPHPLPTGLPAGLQPADRPITTPPIHSGLPLEFNSREGTDHPSRPGPEPSPVPAGDHSAERPHAPTSSPYGVQPWSAGSALPPPEPDGEHAEDEDAIFRNPYIVGDGRETKLSYTALPLRHRIYALHCQGRTISAIARTLRLDRGTVARHLHATEDLLLAEQTQDLARLRLRAIEAQHAILAATWDALMCEELTESDTENDHPYAARRAQLLATAARAARTAAQLQGLFTPAALAAALQSVGEPTAGTPTAGPTATPPCPTGLTAACNSTACPIATAAPDPAATCGMPASVLPASPTGLQPADGSSITPPALQDEPSHSIRGPGSTTMPAAAELPPQFNCGAPAERDHRPTELPPQFNCGAPAERDHRPPSTMIPATQ